MRHDYSWMLILTELMKQPSAHQRWAGNGIQTAPGVKEIRHAVLSCRGDAPDMRQYGKMCKPVSIGTHLMRHAYSCKLMLTKSVKQPSAHQDWAGNGVQTDHIQEEKMGRSC